MMERLELLAELKTAVAEAKALEVEMEKAEAEENEKLEMELYKKVWDKHQIVKRTIAKLTGADEKTVNSMIIKKKMEIENLASRVTV